MYLLIFWLIEHMCQLLHKDNGTKIYIHLQRHSQAYAVSLSPSVLHHSLEKWSTLLWLVLRPPNDGINSQGKIKGQSFYLINLQDHCSFWVYVLSFCVVLVANMLFHVGNETGQTIKLETSHQCSDLSSKHPYQSLVLLMFMCIFDSSIYLIWHRKDEMS